MRVAIVHYWLVSMRGGEKVLEALCDLYPDADIYTHVLDPDRISPKLASRKIQTTFIARLPGARRRYRHYLSFMPLALEMLDLSKYDLVISSEAGPAKGVITRPGCLHVCYCHSPMRYVWDQQPAYLATAGSITRVLAPIIFSQMRRWDVHSASLVDHFVVNSGFVQKRVAKYYRRESTVIYPPVEVSRFMPVESPSLDYYLYFGQLAPYKRVDIAVEAFTNNGRKLIVAGVGEEMKRLRDRAGTNIEFVGRPSDADALDLIQNCRALIFPPEEDFGIVPVEAMAAGRPVIAFKSGGARETVLHDVTGVLFPHQTAGSLNGAVEYFEAHEKSFEPSAARARAECFDVSVFKNRFSKYVADKLVDVD